MLRSTRSTSKLIFDKKYVILRNIFIINIIMTQKVKRLVSVSTFLKLIVMTFTHTHHLNLIIHFFNLII